MAEQLTDEERLAQFSTKLDSLKPEGYVEEDWTKLKDAVVSFHKEDVQGLKINTAKAIKEKDDTQAKYSKLEASYSESNKKIDELNQQLQASSPEEQKKYIENQTATLKNVYEKQLADLKAQVDSLTAKNSELEKGVLERDVLADFNKAASEKNWLGGGREAAQKVALAGIEFTRLNMPDGSVALIDKKTSKDVKTILNDFCGTELGKSFLRSGTSGGGADGSGIGSHSGKKITRAEYNNLTPQQQMDYTLDGYEII